MVPFDARERHEARNRVEQVVRNSGGGAIHQSSAHLPENNATTADIPMYLMYTMYLMHPMYLMHLMYLMQNTPFNELSTHHSL